MGKLLFIANPKSGKARIRNKLLDIVDIFIKSGWDVQVYITQEPEDASREAALHGGDVDFLVCSGGDGTLSETVGGIMKLDRPPLLGYIPAGSTNDFAASLKLPKNMLEAARCVAQRKCRPIDIGLFCQEKNFVYVAGFGAFTEVSYMTPQITKNVLGHQAYVFEGVKSLANIKSYHMKVESEEFSTEGEFIFGVVTNSISVGGFKGLLPRDSALDDGYFEVTLIQAHAASEKLSGIVTHDIHRFRTARIRFLSDEPIDWVLDGEFGGSKSDVMIENLTKRIEIAVGAVKKS